MDTGFMARVVLFPLSGCLGGMAAKAGIGA